MTKKQRSKVRVTVQYSGLAADQMLEATRILGFETCGDCVRHLAQRGLEGLGHQIQARKLMDDIRRQLDPQEMLDFAIKLEKEMTK